MSRPFSQSVGKFVYRLLTERGYAAAYLAVAAIVFAILASTFWYFAIRPLQRHSRAYDRISNSINSLESRRPANVTKNEWSFVLGWTNNAIGNCISVPGFLKDDPESRERFLTLPARLDERLGSDISIASIDWLWNELIVVSKYGQRYSDSWRPTTPERLESTKDIAAGHQGPEVN